MWRLMFRAFHKYLLSFTKSEWGLEDYPVKIVQQESNFSIPGVGEPLPWSAQIINWWLMVGMGDTKFELIKQTYQVDVSDIRTGSFVEIFRRIYQNSPNFTPPD